MEKLLIYINKFFKQREHPFNMDGAEKLNYYNFEYYSAGKVFEGFSQLLGKDISDIVQGKDVLDLGCGAGGKSVYLHEQGAISVYAVDMSNILIEQGKRYIKEKGLSRSVHLQTGDVTKLKFEDSLFDILVANDLMEHVDKPRAMLDEAYRVLKPGGLLLINFEPYYHFLGHHMWDKINIPWAHVLFSEKTRILAYKQLVRDLPDGLERLDFRISKKTDGGEYIGYLNHITYQKYLSLIKRTDFNIYKNRILMIKENIFGLFSFLPYIREPFVRKVITILKKQ